VTTPYERLREAEKVFLTACEWEEVAKDEWREPLLALPRVVHYPEPLPGPLRVLPFGHAVNSEKAHGVARGTCSAEALVALVRAEAQYLRESGWTERDAGWAPPDDRNRQWVRHKQAVNSQKHTDRGSP
jgi:hypothetical protein